MTKTRVAVIGMGVITPIAANLNDFAEGIFDGKVATAPITSFETSPYNVKRGGEVLDFDETSYFSKLNPADYDRTTQFAVAASKMALAHANINPNGLPSHRTGVIIGTTMGNQQTIEHQNNNNLDPTSHNGADVRKFRNFPSASITATVASELGFAGPNMVIPTACAAGNYAIGYASDLIKNNKADYMICGGLDALSRVCFTMFARLGAIAPDLCQPFDRDRKGMMVAEGAGILLLENYDKAIERGATIYAEIAGYGNSCDAYHITSPHPEGYGAVIAMNKALKNSSLSYESIDYISAHGTGTKANDTTESKSIKKIFKAYSSDIPVSSIKSLMGHTMGAASAIEAVASILAIHESKLPVNQNLDNLEPGMDLNVVKEKKDATINYVLSNSFAFGGNISTLVLKK